MYLDLLGKKTIYIQIEVGRKALKVESSNIHSVIFHISFYNFFFKFLPIDKCRSNWSSRTWTSWRGKLIKLVEFYCAQNNLFVLNPS